MAVISGNDLIVKFGVKGNEEATVCATSCTLTINTPMTEVSCKGSGNWYSGVEGQKSWEVTTDNLYDPDVLTGGMIDITELQLTGPNECNVIFGQADVGDLIWQGTARVTASSLNGDANATATWSCTFTGIGELIKGAVPA